jgi:hypothetical protein
MTTSQMETLSVGQKPVHESHTETTASTEQHIVRNKGDFL